MRPRHMRAGSSAPDRQSQEPDDVVSIDAVSAVQFGATMAECISRWCGRGQHPRTANHVLEPAGCAMTSAAGAAHDRPGMFDRTLCGMPARSKPHRI